VIAAGEFDAAEATDERGDSVAIGSTATLDPPNCQLSTTVLLPQRPDVITVTATGTTWDAFGNFEEFEDLGLDEDFGEFVNDWAAEVTLSTEEFRSSIELEVSDDDFVG
jgi:hypothetical protein